MVGVVESWDKQNCRVSALSVPLAHGSIRAFGSLVVRRRKYQGSHGCYVQTFARTVGLDAQRRLAECCL